MYQVHQSNKGYYFFETENSVEYSDYFTEMPETSAYLTQNPLIKNYYYFGIERTSGKVPGKDRFIKLTIASIIVNFFLNNENSLLIFHYTNGDDRLQGRRRLFYTWFKEFSTHTTYQFYQHDFSDHSTVCVLYRRTGATEFDLLRKNQLSMSMIGQC